MKSGKTTADRAESSEKSLGLSAWHGQAQPMERSHRHNDVEFNLIEEGFMTYIIGGRPVTLSAGRLVLFWAAIPHQTVRTAPDTTVWWLTVPLALFLRWHLPEQLTSSVLVGYPVLDAEPVDILLDQVRFRQWHADLATGCEDSRVIVSLEVEARLRRLACSLATSPALSSTDMDAPRPARGDSLDKVEDMARYIAEHSSEPLRVDHIAATVGLNASYAMSLFRKTLGMTLVTYLTHYRIANAQRLLATTNASVLDIALNCGFGSTTRFYVAFKRICGRPPREYRQALRALDAL